MARKFDSGLVYTKQRCVGCNQCISNCPVEGANIARNEGDRTWVSVDESACIACGRCVTVCTHGDRTYRDDTRSFFSDLNDGKKISLLLDDTFYYSYTPEQVSKIIGFLKDAGVEHVYDVAFGAGINLWKTVHFLLDHKDDDDAGSYISSVCPVVVLYLERYKLDLIRKLIPVAPPAYCTARYAKKYLNDKNEFALISNCTAPGLLNSMPENRDFNIRYNITLKRFDEVIRTIDTEGYSGTSDLKGNGIFPGYVFSGSLKKECEMLLPDEDYVSKLTFNSYDIKNMSSETSVFKSQGVRPVVADAMNSENGCLTCAGKIRFAGEIDNIRASFKKNLAGSDARKYYVSLSKEERLAFIDKTFEELDTDDFALPKLLHFDQSISVPLNVIDEVLASLHKHTAEEKHIDCRACGYESCIEMAKAIANGFNVRENCTAYSKGEIRRLASTDTMTGAPNMDRFSEKAAAILNTAQGERFVLGWTDVKNLRIINDVLGYESGNNVLRAFARAIENVLPENGCYGRFADDSFVFMVPYKRGIYQDIKNYAAMKCSEFKNTIPVSIDMGFYEIEERVIYAIKDITRFADNARIAFDTVKGGYDIGIGIYTEAMKQKIIRESELTSLMAVSLERGDFKVYFQPQFDHIHGTMVGAEALVRWIIDGRSVVSPAQFVPLFEKNGFIAKLDAFVWETTCRYLRKWLDEGRQVVPVSVNISRVDIYSEDIGELLDNITNKYQIDRKYLRLEITESAYIKDPESMGQLIDNLHKLGFLVEMDDFGSGYSSLNVLKDMNVDILKLDLKFLAGGNEGRGGSIIQSVIRMAGLLNIPVIAEGVETKAQADFMTSVGCSTIQGFYYAKPMSENEFIRLMGDYIPEIEKKRNDERSRTSFYYGSDLLGKFLSPGSEVTNIFELAIGAAALFEYSFGKLEMIRSNSMFVKETGLTSDLINKHKDDFFDFVYEPDKNRITDKIEKITGTGESVTFTSLWGMDGSVCMRTTAKLIAAAGLRYVIFATIDNVSDLVDITRIRESIHERPFRRK